MKHREEETEKQIKSISDLQDNTKLSHICVSKVKKNREEEDRKNN